MSRVILSISNWTRGHIKSKHLDELDKHSLDVRKMVDKLHYYCFFLFIIIFVEDYI